MRLNKVDLNLFVVFDAVYTERNLTRAAAVLNLTQPAVSNALSRLRESLNDPLFVRTPKAMVPTPVADNIIGSVREALQLLDTSVQQGDKFHPISSQKTFQFSMNDVAETLLFPSLIAHVQRTAPDIILTSYPLDRRDIAQELASGNVDFAIDVPLIADPNLCHEPLLQSHYVCVARPDHPITADHISLAQYVDLKHILVSSRRTGIGHIDIALNALGHQRKIQLRVSHYLSVQSIVEQTDFMMTIPRALARKMPLKVWELPFDMAAVDWHLYWHKSADKDQANRWMRQAIKDQFEVE